MTVDSQFVATGPADVGFKTDGATLKSGASLQGQTVGASFSASSNGPSVSAVSASSPYGSAGLATNISDDSSLPDQPVGAYGESLGTGGVGVRGKGGAVGVYGENLDVSAIGLLAGRDLLNHQLAGVYGESAQQGVYGLGRGDSATGVYGVGKYGVRGDAGDGIGVKGVAQGSGIGVWGQSQGGEAGHFAGKVTVDGPLSVTGPIAGKLTIEGPLTVNGPVTHLSDVTVAGDIFLQNRDLAERFRLAPSADCESGTVMVIGSEGGLEPCRRAYDNRVVGVVAGAGTLRPAITLGGELLDTGDNTTVISMVGTASCRVDAAYGAIEAGDMLTTSDTEGYAMKAVDPVRGREAILGKALTAMAEGQGLVAMLIALQ